MGNAPIEKFKAGSYDVALWENETEKDGVKFKVHSISLKKSWKVGEEWKEAGISSIGVHDIAKVILILRKAYESFVLKDLETKERTA